MQILHATLWRHCHRLLLLQFYQKKVPNISSFLEKIFDFAIYLNFYRIQHPYIPMYCLIADFYFVDFVRALPIADFFDSYLIYLNLYDLRVLQLTMGDSTFEIRFLCA